MPNFMDVFAGGVAGGAKGANEALVLRIKEEAQTARDENLARLHRDLQTEKIKADKEMHTEGATVQKDIAANREAGEEKRHGETQKTLQGNIEATKQRDIQQHEDRMQQAKKQYELLVKSEERAARTGDKADQRAADAAFLETVKLLTGTTKTDKDPLTGEDRTVTTRHDVSALLPLLTARFPGIDKLINVPKENKGFDYYKSLVDKNGTGIPTPVAQTPANISANTPTPTPTPEKRGLLEVPTNTGKDAFFTDNKARVLTEAEKKVAHEADVIATRGQRSKQLQAQGMSKVNADAKASRDIPF